MMREAAGIASPKMTTGEAMPEEVHGTTTLSQQQVGVTNKKHLSHLLKKDGERRKNLSHLEEVGVTSNSPLNNLPKEDGEIYTRYYFCQEFN